MFFRKFFRSGKMPRFPKTDNAVIAPQPVAREIETNLQILLSSIGNPADLVIHHMNYDNGVEAAALVYLTSLADGAVLASHVVEPVNRELRGKNGKIDPDQLRRSLVAGEISETTDLHQAIEYLLRGKALIFLTGTPKASQALAVSFPGFQRRQIEEPPTELVVRGSREGFTEILADNLGMIRRWIRDPNLRVESQIIGERTKTDLAIVYINNVANPDIVREVKKRLAEIQIDGIIDSGYIVEMITDNRLTVFPLVQETERPDKIAAGVLEGRVAILVDKSSFALLVPVTANEFYQTPDDFYYNYWVGTFIRYLRGLGTFISVTLPGFYVSLISINSTLAPIGLTQILTSGRTQIPFPVIFETLIALIIFEIAREAVIRVPGNINMFLAITAGIVLGLVAVQSGLLAGATIIVVIISMLASFTTSNTSMEQAWRIARYFLLLSAGGFGIMGLALSGVAVLTHMASLKSFGVSYLSPWSPPILLDMIDAYFRIPWWLSYRRPPNYRPQEEDRLGSTREEEPKDAD